MVTRLESSLDAQELAGEQRALLDLIDKLQFAQLDNVKLPQIVVVGDQSAGKSSVLEAITGTPFPRDAGACTRFATEIRLRRAPQSSIKVSIIPDKNRPFAEQERLVQFGGMVNPNMRFEDLMRTAVDLIAPKNIPGRFAARDILVVEKRGPDMPLLTLVDLPGLVRNANNDQSPEDIKTIATLSDRYMKSSRTIILAVVGGNSDYVQAPILTKARRFDPNGSRTIGVLTKPDLTESIGLQDKFIDLVLNKDKRNDFKLGWYVLLNPGPREPGQPWPTPEERREAEDAFFSTGKWSTIPRSVCGTRALMQKLSVQLQHHIGKHVHILRTQIQKALDDCEAELRSLGEGKDTVGEMRIELVELFSASKELVIPAVYGFYKNPPKKNFFRVTADPRGTPAQNLRARATEENDRFSQRIRAHGRKFTFTVPASQNPDDPPPINNAKHNFVTQEVEMLLRQIRGSEFPMDPKPRAVYMLFQSYSENWPRLAQEHKDNLGVVCNEFLGELIDYAWPKRMREPLRRHFLDPQMKALMAKAQAELDLLMQDLNLEVQPYDPEYEERLREWQLKSSQDGARYTEAEEVLEKMLIFYELAAKTFIRNTITQVVERHLLQGMYGIFNSVEVLSLTDQIVEAIAAENKETRDRRQTLKVQKKAIEEAKDICASLAMRKELRAYAEESPQDAADTSDEDEPRDTPVSPKRSRRPRGSTSQEFEDSNPRNEPPPVEFSRYGLPIVNNQNNNNNGSRQENASVPVVSRRALNPSPPATGSPALIQAVGGSYTVSSPPQLAPPPPPRPGKVRTDEDGQAYATAPSRSGQRNSQEGAPEQQYNGYTSNNPYASSADQAAAYEAMRRQQRKSVRG
ncbi:P-loop containing nucleoside triphosphate hydrolase protein [Podospora fimiseda]|uniref:P-loop containing nucleoside triphosphate hydrolase protein n=1 Tax=Podospora fimiseda TaxID=252190 RepID=A0AAN7BNH0_9PEZI|nr:P-loop containing nucleoside triphosphate hydrolase protein [Podospora fimiseda]